MLIDAHNHPNWHGHDADRILANMEQHGIDQMWLFSWELPATDCDPRFQGVLPPGAVGIPLADVLEVGRAAPAKFVLGYMPDVKRPDAVDRLKAAVEIHGIRVASELKQRVLFDDPDALEVYRFCGEHKLPITIHLDYPIAAGYRYPRPTWWYGGSLDSFERAVTACPETIFIGHAPGFWAHISGDDCAAKESYPTGPVMPGGRVLHLLDTCPNLYADLSAGSGLTAISRDPAFGKQFLERYQDRLLFGRDYFDGRLMDFLQSLDLEPEAFAKITHRNAQRLLGEPG